MKTSHIFLFCLSLQSWISVQAAEGTQVKVSDSKALKDEGTIIIQKTDEKLLQAPKVFVESGSDSIEGSPESHMKAAYRTWEAACKEWKKELKQHNGSNLMVASCGKPEREVETLQSEKIYTYRSKGSYKIKVIGK